MTSEEAKAIMKSGEMVLKGLNNGFRDMNVNLVDVAISLRNIASALENAGKMNGDYWHPAIGPDGKCPGSEYDWVLVKIRTLGRDMRPSGAVLPVPRISHFVNERWENQTGYIYGTEDYPFEVVYWRPIPGDDCTELYAEGEVVRRCHSYE